MMLEELQRRNYAETTINSYLRTVKEFSRGSTILLHQDAQESLEHRRDPLSEKNTSHANDLEPGRSYAAHRCGTAALPSHSADGTVRHRTPACRTRAPESQRCRQQAHGHSRPKRQGTQRPGCDAQPKTTRGAA